MSGIDYWQKKIKKAEKEVEWDELVPIKDQRKLGPYLIQEYLNHNGDMIEIDMENQSIRSMGQFMRALKVAAPDVDFVLRYSKDGKTAFVKRVDKI